MFRLSFKPSSVYESTFLSTFDVQKLINFVFDEILESVQSSYDKIA